jgi:2-methylcitrate dehydratase PrpD
LLRNAFKPFPCGIVIHAAITAALEIAPGGIAATDVTKIELIVHPLCLQLCGRRTPRSAVEGTFSVFHWVAIALRFGRTSIKYFSDAMTADLAIVSLRDRVEAVADAGYGKDEANIRVTLKDGRVLEHHVDHAIGSVERPLGDADLERKLVDLADGHLPPDKIASLSKLCWTIEQLPNASALLSAAVPDR